MFALLLLSIAASTLAQTPSLLSDIRSCGYQHSDDYTHPDSADTALPDEFSWVASLIYQYPDDGDKVALCSGALISDRYVVTAAQCLASPIQTNLVGVRLGEYHTKNKTDCVLTLGTNACHEVLDRGIEEMIVHPQYNARTMENDIALIRLDQQLADYPDNVRPICVYRGPAFAKPGDMVYISGFGRPSALQDPGDLKKKIVATLVAKDKCQGRYPGSHIQDSQICSQDSDANSVFTCKGDAGAPVMFVVLGKQPQYHLEGVVSWGAGCGSDVVLVHTKVTAYTEWIVQNLTP